MQSALPALTPGRSFLFQAAHRTNSHDGRELPGARIAVSIFGIERCLVASTPFPLAPKLPIPGNAANILACNPIHRCRYTSTTAPPVASRGTEQHRQRSVAGKLDPSREFGTSATPPACRSVRECSLYERTRPQKVCGHTRTNACLALESWRFVHYAASYPDPRGKFV